jgi:DNA-binding transcriptional ArsR family regulator
MLQLSHRPLTGSPVDAELFADREGELAAILRSLRLGFNVLVLGEPGSGRTSLLRQAARRLERPVTFVDAAPWPEPADLVLAIRVALGSDRVPGDRDRVPGDERGPDPGAGAGWRRHPERPLDEADVRRMVEAAGDGGALPAARTVIVDGAEAAVAHTLFGRFRDTLWDYPVRWIVSGDLARRHRYLQPPADAFFETVVELGELDADAARELLARRLDAAADDPDAERLRPVLDQLVAGAPARTPRDLLGEARAVLLSGAPPDQTLRARASAEAEAAAVGRGEAAAYRELKALGPVHAGDRELLHRLGVGRTRAVQLLRSLEAAGLVEGRREGRRKVYAVAGAGEPTG